MKRPLDSLIIGAAGLVAVFSGLLVTPIALNWLGFDLQSNTAQIISWLTGLGLAAVGVFLFIYRQSVSLRHLFGAVAYAMFLVVFSELTLQLAAVLNPRWDFILSELPQMVPDAKLLYRPSPLHPEHDINGFRNETVPARVEVVAVGDSQTYGNNAERDDAWPQQLAEIMQQSVYNMAAGGYSPPQALALIDEAIALDPTTIVFALYSGNDVQETYWTVYLDKIMTQLAAEDSSRVAALVRRENDSPSGYVQRDFNEVDRQLFKLPVILRAGLRVLVSMAEDRDQHWGLYVSQAAVRGEFVLDMPGYRTIFTPQKRLSALDQNDIRIQEGYRIVLGAIIAMRAAAERNDINFLVTLIPTKELVYANVVKELDGYAIPSNYEQLLVAEAAFWQHVKEDLSQYEIAWIDTLGFLRIELRGGEDVYSINNNGHPQAAGYRAIARAVASALDTLDVNKQIVN